MLRDYLPRRKTMRMVGHDYSSPGAYFVTICAYEKQEIFGVMVDECVKPSNLGEFIDREWKRLPERFGSVSLDEFVLMPNHVHGIIVISGPNDLTLGSMMRQFKSTATKQARMWLHDRECKLWHRGFHDHLIRGDRELQNVRRYIRNNPANWAKDEYRFG